MVATARYRSVLVAVLLVATVGLSACGGDDGPAVSGADVSDAGSTTGADADADVTIDLEVIDGALVGGVRRHDVQLGDRVRLAVTGNSDDQVHVHGYDLYIELAESGGSGDITFDALIPGRFEIELEGSGQLLIEVTVS